MNLVILIGRLGRDAELRATPSGKTVTNFTMATSKKFKQGDDWQEVAQWHKVVCWGKLAEKAANMTKGTQVFIRGEIQYREWEKDGQKKSITEILADKVEPFSAARSESRTDESLPSSPEFDDLPF
jgi:single-strand DNA-binding protein